MIDLGAVTRETFAVKRAEQELEGEKSILFGLPPDAEPLTVAAWELSVELAQAALSSARRRLRDAEAGWQPRVEIEPEPIEEHQAAAA